MASSSRRSRQFHMAISTAMPAQKQGWGHSPVDRLVAKASNSSKKMMQPSGNCSHILSMSANNTAGESPIVERGSRCAGCYPLPHTQAQFSSPPCRLGRGVEVVCKQVV